MVVEGFRTQLGHSNKVGGDYPNFAESSEQNETVPLSETVLLELLIASLGLINSGIAHPVQLNLTLAFTRRGLPVQIACCKTLSFVLLLLALFQTSFGEDTRYRISAAKGPYFVVDDRVIEDRWLIDRFSVTLKKISPQPLIRKEFDWEGTGPHAGGSALYDDASHRYRMWYSVFNPDAYKNHLPFSYNVCYAESNDGLKWDRPMLGVFDSLGSSNNNCIKLGTDKTQNIDVCLNPRPDRYRGKFLAIHNQKGGVFVSSSDDGKTFTRLFDEPIISYHSDTHNNFVYDEVRDRWLLYCRPRAWAGNHRRRVALMVSSDLQHWSHERTILIPTETELQEYYGIGVFRRGDLFWGVVQVYDRKTGFMHGELAWSADGERWELLPTHVPFIGRGADGVWDHGMATVMESPVDVDQEMRFYYGGFQLDHESAATNMGAIGCATTGTNRLIGVHPRSHEPGTILTRPFLVNGHNLAINAEVVGRITAELRLDNGRPVPGFTLADSDAITTSGFSLPVTWKQKQLSEVSQDEVRILFHLDNAALFTFDLHR